LNIGPSVVIGGASYSGTVTLRGSRDTVNEQSVNMDATSAIVTSNASVNAVLIADTATDNTPSDANIGGVVLGNITVGNGGTITVDAALTPASHGRIIQQAGTLLDTGANGAVILRARSLLNGASPAVGAGIGTAAQPINVNAAYVTIT